MKFNKKSILIKTTLFLCFALAAIMVKSDAVVSFISSSEEVKTGNQIVEQYETNEINLEMNLEEFAYIDIDEAMIVVPGDRLCWHPWWGFQYDCEAGYCFDEATGSYYPCGWCFDEHHWRWAPCDAMCRNWVTGDFHDCGLCWDRITREYFDCTERYCWHEEWQQWWLCPKEIREGLHSCTLRMLSRMPREYGMCERGDDAFSWGGSTSQGEMLREITDIARDEFLLTGEFPELTSWRDENGRLSHNDQCRQMRQTTASIDVREYFENTVTRTIHFVFEDGTEAAESMVQVATFESVQELISGLQYNVNDDVILPGLPLPSVSSPSPYYMVGQPSSLISPVRVLMDDEDLEKTIVFPLVRRTGNTTGSDEDPSEDDIPYVPHRVASRVNVPNTLSSVPLWVYIIGGVLIISGLTVILIKAKQKNIEE